MSLTKSQTDAGAATSPAADPLPDNAASVEATAERRPARGETSATEDRQALHVETMGAIRPIHPRQPRTTHPLVASFWWLERQISFFVSDRLLPRIPGIHRPYDRLLRRRLHLSKTSVTLEGLDPAWHGARLLLVSDFHTGPFLSSLALRRALIRVRALEPDLILLAGDIVSNRLDEFDSHREAIAELRAEHGVIAVLGNHDHYCGEPERIKSKLGELGVTVLHNRSVALSRTRDGHTGELRLAGIDDLGHGEPDLGRALAEVTDPRAAVLLSHNPDILFEAAERDTGLVVSGHTHGGQIRIPGLPPLITMSRHRITSGHFAWRDSQLVVSRGLGVVGLPIRLFCSPEVVLIELRSAKAQGASRGHPSADCLGSPADAKP